MKTNQFQFSISILVLLTVGMLNLTAFGDELTDISASLIGEEIISIESSNNLIRALVEIENYDPQDGYYFMKVVNLSTNQTFKESEFIPKYVGEQLWGTQIAYLIPDNTTDQIVGHYEIQIFSEFGASTANIPFSIISQNTPLSTLNEEVSFLEVGVSGTTGTTGSTGATGFTGTSGSTGSAEETSKLPEWVRNVFLWYGEDKINETELLNALEFLINQKIITVNLD